MSDAFQPYEGLDRLDRALDALGAIDDLISQCADPQGRAMALVSPDRLATLLGLVLDEFRAARNKLTA